MHKCKCILAPRYSLLQIFEIFNGPFWCSWDTSLQLLNPKSPKVYICPLHNRIYWRNYIKKICDFSCPNWQTGLAVFMRPQNEGRQLICPKSHNLHRGQSKNSSHTPTFIHSSANYMLTTTAPDRQLTSNPLTGFFRVHTVISLCFINIRLSVGFSIDSAMFPSRVGLQKKEIKRMKAAQNFNGRLKSENLRSFLLKNWPYLLS